MIFHLDLNTFTVVVAFNISKPPNFQKNNRNILDLKREATKKFCLPQDRIYYNNISKQIDIVLGYYCVYKKWHSPKFKCKLHFFPFVSLLLMLFLMPLSPKKVKI